MSTPRTCDRLAASHLLACIVAFGGYAAPLTAADAATLHKCAINGSVTYQQSPCPSTQVRKQPSVAELNAVEKSRRAAAPAATTPTTTAPPVAASSVPTAATSGFRCDGRQYCSQMRSCQEATFFLNHCPNVKMDGNRDGIPCEQQWCGR